MFSLRIPTLWYDMPSQPYKNYMVVCQSLKAQTSHHDLWIIGLFVSRIVVSLQNKLNARKKYILLALDFESSICLWFQFPMEVKYFQEFHTQGQNMNMHCQSFDLNSSIVVITSDIVFQKDSLKIRPNLLNKSYVLW